MEEDRGHPRRTGDTVGGPGTPEADRDTGGGPGRQRRSFSQELLPASHIFLSQSEDRMFLLLFITCMSGSYYSTLRRDHAKHPHETESRCEFEQCFI